MEIEGHIRSEVPTPFARPPLTPRDFPPICRRMKTIHILFAGTLLLASWGCGLPLDHSGAAPWPQAPDGFEWPAIDGDALVFETLANRDLDAELRKASESLKSRYSPDDVTFARLDLNADGRDEILIKVHHYGLSPSYAVLSLDELGKYSDIGWISGDRIVRSGGTGGWQALQAWSGDDQIRQLYSYQEGLYQLKRSEQVDAQTGTVTALTPNQAEEGGAGQAATPSGSK